MNKGKSCLLQSWKISAGAFSGIFIAAFKTIDVEIPHIITDIIKIFDKLVICHIFSSKLSILYYTKPLKGLPVLLNKQNDFVKIL